MAYDQFRPIALRIQTRVPTSVDDVVTTLVTLEYTYNLLAVAELVEQGYTPPVGAVLEIMRRAPEVGAFATNHALRAAVDLDARLQLESIAPTNSVKVLLNGMGRVVTAIRELVVSCGPGEAGESAQPTKPVPPATAGDLDRAVDQVLRDTFDHYWHNYKARLPDILGDERGKEFQDLLESRVRDALKSLPPSVIMDDPY